MNALKRTLSVVLIVLAGMTAFGDVSADVSNNCNIEKTAGYLNADPNCADTDTCTLAYLSDERIPLEFRKQECVDSESCSLSYLTDERIPLEFRKDACRSAA
ncbi:MAG: hypothetical protein M9953_12595 [Thermomicrobiales bacterium]|nr:hypothetical protein [Thermomicrobiales bacterium]MCO5226169.1 hypothetical protein [Thermomicrobiales bacterium]MCO5226739.1 hypothetical protein [Thermomicrobiales bacterium]